MLRARVCAWMGGAGVAFLSQISLVFITADLLSRGTVNATTVVVFGLSSGYCLMLVRRHTVAASEEGV